MFYERLTKWSALHTLHVFDINDHEIPLSEVTSLDIDLIAGRLANLEDKIESGDLVDRNDYLDHLMSTKSVLELTNNELDFFVKHNAKIRKFVDEDITRLTAERDDYKSRAEAAEQEASAWKECANKLQKYYKEQVVPLLEEMRYCANKCQRYYKDELVPLLEEMRNKQ